MASECPGWFVLFHGLPVSGYKHDHGMVRVSKWCMREDTENIILGGVNMVQSSVLYYRTCDNLMVLGEIILHYEVIEFTS